MEYWGNEFQRRVQYIHVTLHFQIYEYECKIQKDVLYYLVQFRMRNENLWCKNQHIITLYYYSIYCWIFLYIYTYTLLTNQNHAKYVQNYQFSGIRVHLKCEAHEGHESVTREFEELSWCKIPLGNFVICLTQSEWSIITTISYYPPPLTAATQQQFYYSAGPLLLYPN